MSEPLLSVRNLEIRYEPRRSRSLTAIHDVSFDIRPGEFVGLIGESGSGKTTLGMALLRLIERPGRISEGSIIFDGTDITHLSQDELRSLRWRDISTVFQSSMNSLNPVVRIDAQFRDVIEEHSTLKGKAVDSRIHELFEMVMIDPKFATAFPHELSGGMKQRVNLALALALEPKFVLLDEPTTGLDVVVQHSILENVRRLQREKHFAVLFISHDIGTVLDISDRILVTYAGRIVEEQAASSLLEDPLHPYTKGLLGSYGDPRAETVRITYIPGRPPDLSLGVEGCAFAPRCPERIPMCSTVEPEPTRVGEGVVACHVAVLQRLGNPQGVPVGERTRRFAGPEFVKTASESEEARHHEVVLSVENVSKVYRKRRGFSVDHIPAVSDASFVLRRGEVTALVGQSGSGKSTIARMITAVESPTTGRIVFHGDAGEQEVAGIRGRALRAYRKDVQMVFQDPYSSLNPTKRLGQILARPLRNHLGLSGEELRARIDELLETVALVPASRFVNRYAYELSGGQRQRVVIARALAAEPKVIIADEPISSLDVSIRAEVLELLNEGVQARNVGVLYITHDLLSARMLADEVIVLSQGRVVEQGPALKVIREPEDDYTRQLLDAIPNPFS